MPLCDSARKGKICPDDDCRANPNNTLCGFDLSEFEMVTRDYPEYGEEEEEAGYFEEEPGYLRE